MSEYILYNETVMDRFLNPRNVGDVKDADATAEVGAASCGDILKITLKIDEVTQIITDAKARIFGCGTAISAADMAMDLIKGKTVSELENFSNDDVLNALGGADEWKKKMPQKIHCSVLAESAIKEALDDYKRRKNIK
jgi:nitrogen fixation NifU-like protein